MFDGVLSKREAELAVKRAWWAAKVIAETPEEKEARLARRRAREREPARQYRAENPDKVAAVQAAYHARNREERLARNAEWRARNREKRLQYLNTYQADNLHVYAANEANRRAAKLRAAPRWLTDEHREHMSSLYETAAKLGMHVDHIVPLRGKAVCGLHVPWNLQLLPPADNMSKGNRHV